MQRENTLSRSYLKVTVFIQRLFTNMTICGLSSQHCQQFIILSRLTPLCRCERKLEASVENLPISNHFRASSGQIDSDGGQIMGTQLPCCWLHLPSIRFHICPMILSFKRPKLCWQEESNVIQKLLTTVCMFSWLGNTHVSELDPSWRLSHTVRAFHCTN